MTIKRQLTSERKDAIRTLSIANVGLPNLEKPPMTVVFGNGAFGGPRTFGPIVKRFVHAATAAGQPVHALMYYDPWLGRGVYAEDLRAERLAHMVTYAAAKDTRTHVVGHSWSWPGAVAVAESSPDRIAALEAYTPTGHRGEVAEQFGWGDIARAAITEASQIDIPAVAKNLGAAAALSLAGPGRLAFSGGCSQAIESFEVDVTKRVLNLHSRGMPLGMVLAENDTFFGPSAAVRCELTDAEVVLYDIPATHLGAVLNRNYGKDLFALTQKLPVSYP